MLTLLVILGLVIVQTRNASRSRLAANVADDEANRIPAVSDANGDVTDGERFVETLVTGPNDQQPFEHSEAEYQFQAITDKAPLAAEEMPPYWRLMRWSMTESFDDLWERAHKDRYFTHFGQNPEKHRGELIALNLTLVRSVRHPPETKKNAAGVAQLYEATGITDESRTGLYTVLFYDLPPQLPIRYKIHERVQFVGYFLKLLSYEDALDKHRWTPLLIGRVRLNENAARFAQRQKESEARLLPWLLGGVAVFFVGLAFWTKRYLAASSVTGMESVTTDHQAIEHWLETGGEEGSAEAEGSGWETESDDDGRSRPTNSP
jgi:hypothetical protein